MNFTWFSELEILPIEELTDMVSSHLKENLNGFTRDELYNRLYFKQELDNFVTNYFFKE